MPDSIINLQADIETIGGIDAVGSILEVICRTTGMGFAVVARVTDKQWVACAVRDEIAFGLQPGGELVLETTLCHEVRLTNQVVVIDHVAKDEVYAHHHTPAMYGLQSYIAVPIVLKSGNFFGTLCAIDPNPAQLNNAKILGMFKLFADLIAFHLDAAEQLALSEATLLEERNTAELREQFIAILGHDLRNPVTAIINVAQLMLRMPLDERMARLANILKDSSYRMKSLIENILDFARGHLGEGIILNCTDSEPLEETLNKVIAELEMIWPGRLIEADFALGQPVYCDAKRMEQLFSNLLGNALAHGKIDIPVKVQATSVKGEFVLSVTNAGEKIPAAIMKRLFQPFVRGKGGSDGGLGLGLYIASEIARAHGGAITVESNQTNTCFTLQMPCARKS